ncbi:MAG TPA: hypothetical protein VEE83_00595 [Thermoplasmata archaeon]|nr:hypothetical protein [Thermoplasmata archaeon]
MAATVVPRTMEDEKGLFRIATGAGIGFAAAILAIVIPTAYFLIASYYATGVVSLDQTVSIDVIALLILAGSLLFLFCLFMYRRGFTQLRKVDSRFWVASLLCLIGAVGFLLILVAAVVIAGSANSFLVCLKGHPTHALSCLQSGEPLGAYTAVIGFWLAWLGGVGIVLGLWAGSSRYRVREIGLGAVFYSLLLLVLIGPFISVLVSFPGVEYLLVLVPILSVLAPYFVFRGARPLVT